MYYLFVKSDSDIGVGGRRRRAWVFVQLMLLMYSTIILSSRELLLNGEMLFSYTCSSVVRPPQYSWVEAASLFEYGTFDS